MGNNTEIELKLRFEDIMVWDRINEDDVLKGLSTEGPWNLEELETIYFDTCKRVLKNKGYAYRIRRQGKGWVATLKDMGSSQGGLHQRKEWSFAVSDPKPDISPFLKIPAGNAIKDCLGKEKLVELFRTVFKRKYIILNLPNSTAVEVAADLGAIIRGEKRMPIAEIELELREGNLGELLRLGAKLSHYYNLMPEFNSKYHRALVLAGFIKEESLHNSNEVPADLISCIQQTLLIQESLLRNPSDQEGLKRLKILFSKLRQLLIDVCSPEKLRFLEALDKQIQKTDKCTLNKIRLDNNTPLLLEMWAAFYK